MAKIFHAVKDSTQRAALLGISLVDRTTVGADYRQVSLKAGRPPSRRAAESDRWGMFFLFALATGTRPSEALGLQWGDVDFDAGSVVIQRKLERLNRESSLEETKTPGVAARSPRPPA